MVVTDTTLDVHTSFHMERGWLDGDTQRARRQQACKLARSTDNLDNINKAN